MLFLSCSDWINQMVVLYTCKLHLKSKKIKSTWIPSSSVCSLTWKLDLFSINSISNTISLSVFFWMMIENKGFIVSPDRTSTSLTKIPPTVSSRVALIWWDFVVGWNEYSGFSYVWSAKIHDPQNCFSTSLSMEKGEENDTGNNTKMIVTRAEEYITQYENWNNCNKQLSNCYYS